MKHKDLITSKLDQLSNRLVNLESLLSANRPLSEVRSTIEGMKERLEDLQTLINTQSESWN